MAQSTAEQFQPLFTIEDAHPRAKCCWCQAPLVSILNKRFWRCPSPGCFKRQMAHAVMTFHRGKVQHQYIPLPIQTLFIETVLGQQYRRILFGGAAGVSKLLSLDTTIPTPTGMTTMRDLCVGDHVFGDDGTPTRVVWKSEITIDPRGTYQLTFSDGTTVIAGAGHEWHTFTSADRNAQLKRSQAFRETRRLYRSSRVGKGIDKNGGLKGTGKKPWLAERNRSRGLLHISVPVMGAIHTTEEIARTLMDGERVNHAVLVARPWQLPEQHLPLDSYMLGVWLGDGHSGSGHITGLDQEIFDECAKVGWPVHRLPSSQQTVGVKGLTSKIRGMRLWKNKHVPNAYFIGSYDQRLALLQGLMDTDGCAEYDGGASFSNTRHHLAIAVFRLAASLGVKPTINEYRAKIGNKDCGPYWTVRWTDTLPCFRLSRKLARLKTAIRPTQRFRYIEKCERIDDQPCQCIQVDNTSHQYLITDACIPTHNSHALRWLGHALCLKYPGFKVLLLRRTYKQLENSHIQPSIQEAPALGGKYSGSSMGHTNSVQYANGSSLKFGHCEKKTDEINYLSDEYDLILFDEETTFEESQIVLIGSRARTSRSDGWNPLVAGGTNPGGISAQYCLSHFIDKNPDPQKYPNYQPNDYIYIAGTLDDNPYLNVSYEQSLNDLPRELREAYRYGNWNIFPGQFFGEFKTRVHTALIAVPEGVERFCGLDWGYTNPGVCIWIAALPDGKMYVEDEYIFTETIASDVAKEILRRNKQRNIFVRYTAADPSMWAKGGQTGESIAETMRKAGLNGLRPAKNDRVIGWQRVRSLLRLDQDGIPFLQINPKTCPYGVRTFPQQISDKQDPEDMCSDGEDHFLDSLRYACMSRPTPTTISRGHRWAPKEAVRGKVGELMWELREGASH